MLHLQSDHCYLRFGCFAVAGRAHCAMGGRGGETARKAAGKSVGKLGNASSSIFGWRKCSAVANCRIKNAFWNAILTVACAKEVGFVVSYVLRTLTEMNYQKHFTAIDGLG